MATAEARENIITLVVGMFNAAPGAQILNSLVIAHDAGMSIQDIADVLSTKAQFDVVYPPNLTNEEFAASLVDNLLTEATPAGAKTWATNWVLTQVNGGATRAEVIVEALAALRATDNENYADAQAQLANRVEVATHYSVTQQQSSTDLGELQAVVADVTSDEDTVDDAIADIDEEAGANGETFVLAGTEDSIDGTSANDNIRALSLVDVFTKFDDIDGGAGIDTFDIYTDTGINVAFPDFAEVENVEIVNVHNAGAAVGAFGDASNFQGVQQLWQIGDAVAVTNLLASTTAGFDTIAAGTLSVGAAASETSATVSLIDVDDATTLDLTGTKLDTVNISGNVTGGGDLAVDVSLGAGTKTATVNSAVATDLTFTGVVPATIDATGSTGDITTAGAATTASIMTGTGDDAVISTTATTATVSASVETGEGDDDVVVNTSGTGTNSIDTGEGDDEVELNSTTTGATTVDTGAGDDEVLLTTDSAGKLTVNLGAGADAFNVSGAGVVNATDVVDGGADIDTLLLSIVGATNIGAFQNFELFDVAGLTGALDVDILASKNTVTEIVGSDALGGAATLQNIGAGVNFRATDDMDPTVLTLTQKTAGALTVALDIDETGTVAATTVATNADAAVQATNATAITVDFDSDFVGKATLATDNATSFAVTGDAATTLTVNSSGDNAANALVYTDSADKLTTVTVTGDSALNLDLVGSTKVMTVDASAMTGDLTFNAADLHASVGDTFDGGQVKLGSGDDAVAIVTGARISGIELGAEEDETTQDGFDVIVAAAVQATDAATADVDIENGLATFLGAGPATLTEAIADVIAATGGATAAVFEYIGNSYVVAGADVVQLVGVTGLEGLDDVGGASLYVF